MHEQSSANERARHDDREREHDEIGPCAVCMDSGWVTIGQLVIDPETGLEAEEYALYLCRCRGAK